MTPCICVMLIFFTLLSFYSLFCIALDYQGQRGRTIPVAALEQWRTNSSGWLVGGGKEGKEGTVGMRGGHCNAAPAFSSLHAMASFPWQPTLTIHFQLEQTQNTLPWASRQCQEPISIFLAPTRGEWSSLFKSKPPGCLTVTFTIHSFYLDSYSHQCKNQWAVNNCQRFNVNVFIVKCRWMNNSWPK